MPLIQHEKLRAIIRSIASASGSMGNEPTLVADNLVGANLNGHDSHGVVMMPRYVKCIQTGELRPNATAKILVDDGPVVVMDGHQGYGQVIGREAMDISIARAKKYGVCILTIRRTFHLGRIGAWAEQCAEAGLVSMHHVNLVGSPGHVAPFRGSDARLPTNPYCCALPATKANPATVLDMATSVVAMGKVQVARNKGERLADGVLIDGKGRSTTDPNAMFANPPGAILAFGEHKGYGLSLVNELLAGALSGGGTTRPDTEHENDTILNNMLSIIIDPKRLLSDPGVYETEVDASIAHVKASPPIDPDKPVLVPGDPERVTYKCRESTGIPVDDETWRQLVESACSVGIDRAQIEDIAGLS